MANIDIRKFNNKASKKETSKDVEGWSVMDLLNKEISLFGAQFNDKKKERFYSELFILLQAGVDIKTSLELIEEEQQKPAEKKLFETIKHYVINGGSLSEAIRDSGKFSAYEYYSLQIGEESGRITEVLEELTNYYAKKIKLKRMVVSALSYPMIVLCVAIGAIFFMMKFIVPMFADVFARFGGKLPKLTQTIISLSKAMSAYSGYVVLIILLIGFVLYRFRNSKVYRSISSALLLKTPFVGQLISKIYLARFCHSMDLLISSKTPMIQAIQLVRKMIGFYPIEKSLDEVEKDIMKGASIHESLSKFPIYNRRMLSLIKVAEEINQLDMMFKKLAKQYTDDVEHQTGLIGSLIEPLMIIFLGLMVAVVLVSMYLPLFQLSSSFGK